MAQQQLVSDPTLFQQFLNFFKAAPESQRAEMIQEMSQYHPRAMLQNPPQVGVVKPDPEDPLARIVEVDGRRQLEQVMEINEEQALAHLTERTFGRPIDGKYKMYCAAMLKEYFDACKLYDKKERARLLNVTVNRHLSEKMREAPFFTWNSFDYIVQYNHQQSGVVQRRHPIFGYIQTKSLSDPENINGLPPLPTSFNLFHKIILTTSAVMTASAAMYLGYRVFRALASGTTIHLDPKQLQQLISIATNRSSCPNINPCSYDSSTDTLRSLSAIPLHTLALNTVTQCGLLLKETFTSVVSTILRRIDESSQR